jgi:penicillin-binding protein 1C
MAGLGRTYWALVGCLVAIVVLLGLDSVFPPPLERAQLVSTVVRDRNGQVLRAFPVEDGRWRLAARLEAIDPDFVDALIAYEDERFHAHPGIDPAAILRAGWNGLRAGRIVSGASTLTMQTARLLEPRQRTLGAKLLQMVRAVQIELRLSKPEILELYLTLAPYGGNLEGVRAASWAYFGREPDELTIEQIALLIALPQSPEARRPDLHPEAAHDARRRVLERLSGVGLASGQAAADAALDPVATRSAFPAYAWHAAEWLHANQPNEDNLVSTLDLGLQVSIDQLVADNLPLGDDVAQIAILVVETETRAVRALVGSASRARPGGWIDLTHRARSPGSTLKPFIYGMAFDDGLAAANTRIADLPVRFAGYRPDNFDRRFRGDVTIAEALQHSLNVPAVTTLDSIGARRFNAALSFAGARPERPRRAGHDDGLAVALGGAGLSVRQIAMLYAALGDGGRAMPLRWLETAPADRGGFSLISEESAHEVLDILRGAPHPGGRMPAALTRGAPDIAFKTGTSYGFRDAWAAGVSGGYTVVVWTGRADGAPREGITGREGALPLLFRVFDHLTIYDPPQSTISTQIADLSAVPSTMRRFESDQAPHILFPPDQSEILADRGGRGFVLSAQGDGIMTWYADGERVSRNAAGDVVWHPPGAGFYAIDVVDASGRHSRTRVRVLVDL